MVRWIYICLILCTYGFFKSLRPSEPFDVQYLIEYKNFTLDDIIHVAFPVSTYTWFATIPIAFFLTSYLNYLPVIYIEAIALNLIFGLMIWGNGFSSLLMIEGFYGILASSEVAYYTYIYAKVETQYYHRVTSFVHSAIALGTFISAIISQLLVSLDLLSLLGLTYISFASSLASFSVILFLPKISTSRTTVKASIFKTAIKKCKTIGTELSKSLKIRTVLMYSAWLAIEKTGNMQVSTYYKTLVQDKIYENGQEEENEIYTATVQAVQCAFGVFFSIVIAYLPINWDKLGNSFLCCISIAQGLSLLGMSNSDSVILTYILIVIYFVLHQVSQIFTSAEIAKYVEESSRGIIFGLNTFVAAGLQVILTVTVNSKSGFTLPIKTQFYFYSGTNLILGLIYMIISIYYVRHR